MRVLRSLPQRLSLLAVLSSAVQAAIYVSGSTCTVTPLSAGGNAAAARSLGTLLPMERDVGAALEDGILEGEGGTEEPLFVGIEADITDWDPEPLRPVIPGGAPGAMGHYPRPIPTPGSKPPVRRAVRAPARAVEQRDPYASVDDTPQILQAFRTCGKDGRIVFTEGTYNLRQVMNTTDLSNCDIEIHGKWIWSGDNIQYASISRPVQYTLLGVSQGSIFALSNCRV